jgi:alcohol dehydrogenase class IV
MTETKEREMINAFLFSSPGKIVFEPNGIQKVGEELKTLGVKKPLLVTDKGVKGSGLLVRLIGPLDAAGIPYSVFDEVEPNPDTEVVQKGLALLRKEGCDSLIGLGGGSAIDAAKAVGVQATNPDSLRKYEGANRVVTAPPPIVAIPTTAGTGSEVTGTTVITDKARQYKFSVRSPLLIPKVALLDPTLLFSLPPTVLAATGMDVLTHAYESFVSLATNPVSQALAYDSIRLVSQYLRKFYANPENVEAASCMMLASTMAGVAFFNGRLGIVHAMAHPLGGVFNTPHGVANAILLPHCMEFTRLAAPQLFVRVAEAFGKDTRGLSSEDASKLAVRAVRELMEDIRIPKGLKEVGVTRDAFPRMAENAVESGIHLTTPTQVTRDDMISLYETAF